MLQRQVFLSKVYYTDYIVVVVVLYHPSFPLNLPSAIITTRFV